MFQKCKSLRQGSLLSLRSSVWLLRRYLPQVQGDQLLSFKPSTSISVNELYEDLLLVRSATKTSLRELVTVKDHLRGRQGCLIPSFIFIKIDLLYIHRRLTSGGPGRESQIRSGAQAVSAFVRGLGAAVAERSRRPKLRDKVEKAVFRRLYQIDTVHRNKRP